MRPSAI